MTGRPAWVPTDTVCQEAREMASNGLTVAQIADCLGISESTLYGKQNDYKQFMDAIKKGRVEGLHKVSNALFEKATHFVRYHFIGVFFSTPPVFVNLLFISA